jgi:hypothetical protein
MAQVPDALMTTNCLRMSRLCSRTSTLYKYATFSRPYQRMRRGKRYFNLECKEGPVADRLTMEHGSPASSERLKLYRLYIYIYNLNRVYLVPRLFTSKLASMSRLINVGVPFLFPPLRQRYEEIQQRAVYSRFPGLPLMLNNLLIGFSIVRQN